MAEHQRPVRLNYATPPPRRPPARNWRGTLVVFLIVVFPFSVAVVVWALLILAGVIR